MIFRARLNRSFQPTPPSSLRTSLVIKERRMISDRGLAQETSTLMLEYGARLDGLVAQAQAVCPESEFRNFRRAIGTVMGHMLLEVMNRLYCKHTDLKPEQLK
jgi:hypothetical protein